VQDVSLVAHAAPLVDSHGDKASGGSKRFMTRLVASFGADSSIRNARVRLDGRTVVVLDAGGNVHVPALEMP
jgi:hypothetical protein